MLEHELHQTHAWLKKHPELWRIRGEWDGVAIMARRIRDLDDLAYCLRSIADIWKLTDGCPKGPVMTIAISEASRRKLTLTGQANLLATALHSGMGLKHLVTVSNHRPSSPIVMILRPPIGINWDGILDKAVAKVRKDYDAAENVAWG